MTSSSLAFRDKAPMAIAEDKSVFERITVDGDFNNQYFIYAIVERMECIHHGYRVEPLYHGTVNGIERDTSSRRLTLTISDPNKKTKASDEIKINMTFAKGKELTTEQEALLLAMFKAPSQARENMDMVPSI